METGNKNRCLTELKLGMFCEDRLGLELFQNGSVHEFYRLKALITLEQVNTSVVERKKGRILIRKIKD